VGLLCVVAFAACGDDDDNSASAGDGTQQPKLAVVATTVQIEAITREVGGDRIELDGIVPAGADAHEFEPVASDLAAIGNADLILRHGAGLDAWLDDTLEANADAPVITVTEGITFEDPALEHADEEEEEEGHVEEGLDPHVWHDPDNVKIMTADIAVALADADPANAAAYQANAEAYEAKLDATKAQVQAIIDEIPTANRKLVTNHDAFGYFARAFGLEIVGAVIPSTSTEAEPSAQDTAALLETIEREQVKAIFAESSVNPALAETLASDAGITIVDDLYGDSLGEPGSGAETVDGMLLTNARKIADALK
jgi:ABC-type Zn uptake system ZnuABC Zn-binding protein ZnuA